MKSNTSVSRQTRRTTSHPSFMKHSPLLIVVNLGSALSLLAECWYWEEKWRVGVVMSP